MKRAVSISLLLSLSLLFGGQAGKAKASLNLGLANGASFGVGLDSPHGENRDNYLNIHAYYCRLFWYAGICREIRTYNDRNDFYYLVSAGVNIGQMLPYPLDRDLFVWRASGGVRLIGGACVQLLNAQALERGSGG